MDKCPSIIFESDNFRFCSDIVLEKYTCATADVHQQIMKA